MTRLFVRGRWLVPAILGLLLVGGSVSAFAFSTTPTYNFTLVGHNALYDRGMNAAGAIYDHWMFVGNRTDGTPGHTHPGTLILDIANPANPTVVGELPYPTLATMGYSSREMRVWTQQKVLMIMYIPCDATIHRCTIPGDAGTPKTTNQTRIDFWDLSEDPANPKLLATYTPSVIPHEMFLWADPKQPATRALLFWTSPNQSAAGKSLVVTDISHWRKGQFPEIADFDIASQYTADESNNYDVRLHSISVSPDGTRMYLAHLGGGFLVTDTSDFANNVPHPKVRLITPIANRVYWDNQGAHSSVKVPSKPYALTTEEIYGNGLVLQPIFGFATSGCPWGWVRMIDIHDAVHPKLVQEYKIPQNTCTGVDQQTTSFNSFASHNPTLLPDVGFVAWHSGGLQALDLSNPAHVVPAGVYSATPEAMVTTEDPVLTSGDFKTAMWSYPIIRNGLIYVVDIRNGVFVLKYNGTHADEVAGIAFLEGNSNLGDAGRLEAGIVNTGKTFAAPVPAPIIPGLPDTGARAAWVAGPAIALLLAALGGLGWWQAGAARRARAGR